MSDMESPKRKALKSRDYRRHRMMRLLNRRKATAQEAMSEIAEKELMRRLRITPLKKFEDGKDADGGIKKYVGALEDVGYNAGNMKFYEKATGKELGDSAILDEVIVNGRDRVNDYLTEANESTAVYNVAHRDYNPHLKYRAEDGASLRGLEEVASIFDRPSFFSGTGQGYYLVDKAREGIQNYLHNMYEQQRLDEASVDRPYNEMMDVVPNNKRGIYPGEPLYYSRLGMMGLVKDKEKENVYHMYDENGDFIRECAKFANKFSANVGRPVIGDAWNTKGLYGDSVVYDGGMASVLPTPIKAALSTINKPDKHSLETGDIVDLYNRTSRYNAKARNEGRGNSHTGRIYKPKGKYGPTYIIHNVGGDIKIEPFGDFTSGTKGGYKIARISRPGTAQHPYK